ncbi:predicted protein [Lichtheimia corymbifera JMRC:FSU:9682]|uniref:Uncharacterized protein n=1 Tax=Lichtheimia corymbifera JMRC:FSU:9682 TaxID=1263082 RepID=A0A068S192_9FUNG|nr:predicted protein [Lichtheimia corymbifera JMRC:FSU:9682]
MKRRVLHRAKLPTGVKRILCRSFTIAVADLTFTQSHHQPRRKKNSRGRPYDLLWLVVTLGESENGERDRETCTQGALHPGEQLCSIKEPTFHCKLVWHFIQVYHGMVDKPKIITASESILFEIVWSMRREIGDGIMYTKGKVDALDVGTVMGSKGSKRYRTWQTNAFLDQHDGMTIG